MNAGRTVGMMGIAIGLATAITIGASPSSGPQGPRIDQNQQAPSGLKPIAYRSLRNDVSPRLDAIKPVPTTPQDANRVRINKILPSRVQMARQTTRFSRDPIVQLWHGSGLMPSPIANFEGVPNVNGVLPPDTQGAVGTDHYVQWVNLAFAVYNKTGTKIYPAAPGTYANGNTLWSGFGGACETSNDGDPITLFDRQAGRWLMTQFALPNYPNSPFYECFAISTTGDPTGTWYRYEWVSPSNKMNDYPKFGIWPDGYYMTVNQFASGTGSWAGAGVAVFNRDQMLAGLPAQSVYFDLFGVDPNLGGMLPSDSDGATPPPAGSPNFFLMFDDDGWGYPADQLELFKFHVDWTTPANSTFTGPTIINLTALGYPFDSNLCGGNRSCIPQPDTSQGLDPISDRLMHRMAYRNFGDHEALVFNHTVDANGSDHAGIRWYEMRAPNGTPTIYQAGTYAPDADHRWMGSLSMDASGSIALGYSVSSSSTYPSIRYVGRLAGDPLGTLPQGETSIIAGSGSQTHSAARWGDYSMMGPDPTDDCTFWYTQEYIQTTGSANWQTRIASFKFPSCTTGAAGILSGTVTDSSSSLPIQSVRVQVGGAFETQTAANGTYAFLSVPVGTYDVTFSKQGYQPETSNGVSITSGNTTTLDAALDASPPATVSGVVHDGSGHGWPLYARIDVAGIPSKTTYTNPATGEYSISLWAGATYDLTATSLAPGYLVGSGSATPSGSPATATLDFNLAINAGSCTAPGYALAPSSIFTTDFEATNGGFAGGGTLSSWAWGIPTNGPGSAHSGTKIWATNLSGNYNTNEVSTLTSPAIDLSAYAGQAPSISWWQWLQTEATWDKAYVDVSNNGGSTWTTVYGPVTGTVDSSWTLRTVALNSSYAVSNFRLRFRLVADFIYDYPGWYVDDVTVATNACTQVSGGMIVGTVTDANTGTALVGATVTGVAHPADTATSVATPDDPNLPDGIYRLFSSATGTLAFDGAKAGGYGTQQISVGVLADQVVAQDFQLPAGRLTGIPASMTVEVPLGTTTTREFTLTNSGAVAANYSLKEFRSNTPQPARAEGGLNRPAAAASLQLPLERDDLDGPSRRGQPQTDQPVTPPLAAGSVIQSWSSGLLGPWGVAFDSVDDTVWVSSPVASWSGQNRIAEYSRTGVATGRFYGFTWAPANGPADAAFNWNTGRIWVMNIASGVSNCIREINPSTGPTGTTICPGGGTGFAISQRAVAYDPTTDTWYAGGWNVPQTIYHFSSAGTILDSKLVGIAIAGMAYNPDTHHLFVIVNADPTLVYVYNTADNYSLVGSFSIPGFAAFAGTGLELMCNGHLWANNVVDGRTYEIDSGETTSVCTTDHSWYSVSPTSGSLAPAASQPITVTFDARTSAGITEPGEHVGGITIWHDTPYGALSFPVTMNVTKAMPVITWPNPAPIVQGTALSGTQLNATADVPGSFVYDPPAGTVLDVGNGQVLSTTFTPTDTTHYSVATATATIDVTPAVLMVTGVTPSPGSPVTAGTPVTWTVTTTGGIAPLQYEFWLNRSGTWSLLQAYSTSSTAPWTPTQAGSYTVQVWVKSAGSGASYDAYGNSTPFTVTGDLLLSVTEVTPSPGSPVTTGTPVTWSVSTIGGTAPLQYEFWLNRSGTWSLLQAYGPSNTAPWVPALPGSYVVQVWVKNAGSGATYDAYGNSVPFTVTGDPLLSVTGVTPSPGSPVATGTPVTWSVSTIGGTAPLQYEFWLNRSGNWSLLQAYSPASTAEWTPTQAGSYVVQVWVKNAGSGASYDAYGNSAPFTVTGTPALTVTEVMPTPGSPVGVGTPVSWSVTTTGGIAPLQYQFWLNRSGTWTLLQAYSPSSTAPWTPTQTGTYVVQVWVKNAGSGTTYDAYGNSSVFIVQ